MGRFRESNTLFGSGSNPVLPPNIGVMMMKSNLKLVQNEAQCRKCSDIIFSRSRHHYQECKCGAIAVDGGLDYQRRVGLPDNFIERSLYLPTEVIASMVEAVKWSRDTGRNEFGTALAVLRVLRDNDLLKNEPFSVETD